MYREMDREEEHLQDEVIPQQQQDQEPQIQLSSSSAAATNTNNSNNEIHVQEEKEPSVTTQQQQQQHQIEDDDDDDLPPLDDYNDNATEKLKGQENQTEESDDDDGPPPLAEDNEIPVVTTKELEQQPREEEEQQEPERDFFPRSEIELVKVEIDDDVKAILHYQYHKDDEEPLYIPPKKKTIDDFLPPPPPSENQQEKVIHEALIADREKEKQSEESMNHFKALEFAKIEKAFSTDESLQRMMVSERARMERQGLEREFEKDQIQIRENLIGAIRSKLQQQSTFPSYHQENESNTETNTSIDPKEIRRVAQEELSKLNQLVEGMKVFAVEPRQVDLQLFKARNVLLSSFQNDILAEMRTVMNLDEEKSSSSSSPPKFQVSGGDGSTTANTSEKDVLFLENVEENSQFKSTHLPPPPPPSSLPLRFAANEERSRNTTSAGQEELSLRDRIKLVVDIKDLCDKLKRMKMNALGSPRRWEEMEELYEESLRVANQVPVGATLSLKGTKAELERFIRTHSI